MWNPEHPLVHGGRRRLAIALAFLLGLALLAACGSDGGETSAVGDEPAGGSTDETVEASTYPLTISQANGEVTIAKKPERVVALDFPSADAALALGVVPIGMADLTYVDGGVFPWTGTALDGAEPDLFVTDHGYPFEAIAALEPDLILAVSNAWPDVGDHWDTLNGIAPVVAYKTGRAQDTWQQGITLVGQALGQPERAAELIAEIEEDIADARDANPSFAGKTLTFFNYVGGQLYVVSTNDDSAVKLLQELGLAGVTDTVKAMPGQGGRADISPELYPEIEADVVLGTSVDGKMDELRGSPFFGQVPAVQRGTFIPLESDVSTALVYPSALSLPYAFGDLVPALAEVLAVR